MIRIEDEGNGVDFIVHNPDEGLWLTIGDFSVHLYLKGGGDRLAVAVYELHNEMKSPYLKGEANRST